MIIDIDNVIIDFKFNTEFPNFKKYETNKSPEYIVNFFEGKIDTPNTFDEETTFYDKYQNIQYQKRNSTYFGKIEYTDKIINVTMEQINHVDEYLFAQYAFYNIFESKNNYLLMHGSAICYKNKGIIFTAKSGTGKSTHVLHWLKNTEAIIINDDKNLLKLENDKIILISNPFSGKHERDSNIKVELKDVVFIIRDDYNHVEPSNKKEAFKRLLPQLVMPNNNNQELWQCIMNKLLKLNTYDLFCTKEIDSLYKIKEVIDNETN